MKDRGLIDFLHLKRERAYYRERAYLTGGLKRGFTVTLYE